MAKEETLLKEIKDNLSRDVDYYRRIREEAKIDRRYLSLDPWDPAEKQQRQADGRPYLVLDQLNQHVSGVCNEFDINPRDVSVSPTGSGANDDEAFLRSAIIRQIHYETQAREAHSTAYRCAVESSYGVWALGSQYDEYSDDPFDQSIITRRIADPDTVYWDPDCTEADFSDMNHAIIRRFMRTAEFKRRFKGARVKDFTPEMQVANPYFLTHNGVWVGEYWNVEEEKDTLVRISGQNGDHANIRLSEYEGAAIQGSMLIMQQAAFPIVRGSDDVPMIKKVIKRQVKWYLTNGEEILDKDDWPGSWIPVFPVVGRELWVNSGTEDRNWFSLIRGARESQQLLNYTATCALEAISMVPKTEWVMAEGQIEGHEKEWAEAHHRPQTALLYKPMTDATGTAMLPPPRNVSFSPPIEALQGLMSAASGMIQAAIGRYNSSLGRHDSSVRSAEQARLLDQSADVSTYHFKAAYDRAVRHESRCIDELITKFYAGTSRTVLARKRSGDMLKVSLNGITEDEDGNPITGRITNKRYVVTIDSGPDWNSQRDRAGNFADSLLERAPDLMGKIGDLIVRLKDLGPIGKDLEARLAPPDQQQQQEGGPQLQKAGQLIDQLTHTINVLTEERDKKLLELSSKEKIEAMRLQVDKYKAELLALTTHEKITSEENKTLLNHRMALSLQQASDQLDRELQQANDSATRESAQLSEEAPAGAGASS